MDVRQVRPTDAPLVLSLALDPTSHLVRPADARFSGSSARSAGRALLPLAVPGRSWIARNGSDVALLEAHPRRYVIGWDINRLAVRGSMDLVLPEVVGAAIMHLQARGVPRLFARCAIDSSHVLRDTGFMALCREYLLAGIGTCEHEDLPLPENSRYRMPPDAWPLHQLESEITPAYVRQVEGVTSMDWTHQRRGTSEIVVEQDGRIVAWMGWGQRLSSDWVEVRLLLQYGHTGLGPALLHHASKSLAPGTRFLSRVREYQAETMRTFIDAGFDLLGEEILMVKHAGTETVRQKNRLLRTATVPGIQALPIRHKRVEHGLRASASGISRQG